MTFVGVVCFYPGDVHFRYIAIEVIGLGNLLVWCHHKFFTSDKANKDTMLSKSE